MRPAFNKPDPNEQHESELIIAYFRALLMIVGWLNPGLMFGVPREPTEAAFLMGAVAAYNIFTGLAIWRRWRMRYRRHLMLLMDVALISLWLLISGPDYTGLFALYYVVVFIAALWFKVFGAVLIAALCSGLWIAIGTEKDILLPALFAPFPALVLLAVLGGFICEIHDRERATAQALRQRVDVYEREIDLSREIQRLLRPEALPQPAGLEIGAADRPSRAVGGGDYYDAFTLSDHEIALCLADVAGKSIRAQSRLPLLKYALRAVTRENHDPATVVKSLNEMLYADLQPDLFVTLLFAVVDARARQIRFCNAGHSAPIRYGANGARPEVVASSSPAIGLLPDAPYRTGVLDFPTAGGGVVFYTDGVVNATHRVTGEFGEERLLNLIAQRREDPAQKLATEIVRCVDDFEESTRSDDVTVLVLKAENVNRET